MIFRDSLVLRFLQVLILLAIVACGQEERSAEIPAEAPTGASPKPSVVVYTALDQIYSEPILADFTAETGIEVDAVYDTEAAKTTGLVTRLLAERERPRCDVFWNNEVVQTIRLEKEGLLDAYLPRHAAALPAGFRDPDNMWTGFAARARVLAFNTDQMTREEAPKSIDDLLDPRHWGRFGMAYPLFGTTATHFAVIQARRGADGARKLAEALNANGVKIMEGNGAVCRAVAAGEIPMGLTDSDDVNLQRTQGRPVEWVLIDHQGEGALLIPNTLAPIKGSPNPDGGRKLIEWLLRPEIEARLAASPSAQIPLLPVVNAEELPEAVRELKGAKFLLPDYERAAEALPASADMLKTLFSRP